MSQPQTEPTVERDPDLGPPPSAAVAPPVNVAEKLDQAELAIRAQKLRFIQAGARMVEEANDLTRFRG